MYRRRGTRGARTARYKRNRFGRRHGYVGRRRAYMAKLRRLRKTYRKYKKNPHVVRRTAKRSLGYVHEIIQPYATAVWLQYQDMPSGSSPILFANNAANVWSCESAARVNDIVNPSTAAGDAYMTGRLTYQRLYQYMRPYKFKSRWVLDFIGSGTSLGTDYFHVFTIPTLSASSPWQTLFTIALDVRYMVTVARKNRYMTYKRFKVNKSDNNSRCVITSKTVSLKSLLGVNPAFQVNQLGQIIDSWSTTVTGTPAGSIYFHILVCREFTSTSAPQHAVVFNHNYNTKVLYWQQRTYNVDDGASDTI